MNLSQQAPRTPPRWRRALWLIARLVFVAGIFYVIFRTADIDFNQLRDEARQIRWVWVPLALVVWLVAIGVASCRWFILLNVVKRGFTVYALVALNLIGIFYSQFLPGLISGDVVKGYYLARGGNTKVNVLSSAIMDRILGIGVNGVLGMAALALSPLVMDMFTLPAYMPFVVLGAVIVALGIGFWLVGVLERFEASFPGWLQTAFEPIKLYTRHPVGLAAAAGTSILYFALWTLAFWALGAAVGIAHLGFFAMLLLLAVVNVAQFLPLSINGAGLREGAVVALLSAYGIAEEKALVFALLIPLTNLGLAALGGLLMLADYRPRQPEPGSEHT